MHVLVAEDGADSLAVLGCVVESILGRTLEAYDDPLAAREARRGVVPADRRMPGIGGPDFMRRLRADPRSEHARVVTITSDAVRALKREAIEAGATDFLDKPIDAHELKARASKLLRPRQARVIPAGRAHWLIRGVEKATARRLARERDITWRSVRATERRSAFGEHVQHVATVSMIVAEEYGLPAERRRENPLAAPLYDVGKIGAPGAILNKPAWLSQDEIAQVRRRVTYGAEILADEGSDFVRATAYTALTHHERCVGTGCPNGRFGERIAIEGGIVALAGAFNAPHTARPGKLARDAGAAPEAIRALSIRQFDPACVAAFEYGRSRMAALAKPHASNVSAA